MPVHDYKICASGGTLTNIETLTTLSDNWSTQSQYYPYQEVVQTASGAARGLGSAVVEWRFEAAMPYAMYNALRAICPGASASVDIRTITTDYVTPTYANYHATLIWPDPGSYEHFDGFYTGIVLKFVNLVSY